MLKNHQHSRSFTAVLANQNSFDVFRDFWSSSDWAIEEKSCYLLLFYEYSL